MSQLTLDGTGTPTPPDVRLTVRQRWALEIISEKEPIPSELLGAYLHELRAVEGTGNGHAHEDVCRFCRQEGEGMGRRLRDLGLVRYSRKRGGWALATTRVLPRVVVDPSLQEIPF